MPAALRAVHFDPRHAVAPIRRRADRALDRAVEARPAGAALVLRVRRKERLAAAGARERAVAFFMEQRAAAPVLGAVLGQHVELLGRQRRFPVGVGFVRHRSYCSTASDGYDDRAAPFETRAAPANDAMKRSALRRSNVFDAAIA